MPNESNLNGKATAFSAHSSVDWQGVSPILRTLLLSDGTVTTFLEAYFYETIQMRVLAHEQGDFGDLPRLEIRAGTPVLRRITTFSGAKSGRIVCHAVSYLRPELLWPGAAEDLLEGKVGVGEIMRAKRVETYREILSVERTSAAHGPAAELGIKLGDDLVTRTYRIYVQRKPCILITDAYPVRLFD